MPHHPLHRPVLTCVALAALATLSACGGGGGSTPTPTSTARATASASSSTSTSTSTSSVPSDGGISAGNVVFTSTLQPPTKDIATNDAVTQDANGITLHVNKAGGGYTYAQISDFHGIPQDIVIRVHVAMASPASGIYYGVACRGFGQNQQYLLLSDAAGKWVIVQVKDGNQTALKQGTADNVDATQGVTVDAACVTPQSNDKMNRLVLALNGKVVGVAEDSFENVAISNTFELFAISPDSSTGTGSVVFNRLQVRSASAAT